MSEVNKAKRLKYIALASVLAVLMIPLFQNCAPYFADTSAGLLSSASSDPMSAKAAISIGTRSFSVKPPEDLIASKAYQLTSTAPNYTLKLTSVPDSACAISVGQIITCSYAAIANITVQEKDSRGQLIANHEAVFNVVNPSTLLAKGTSVYNTNCASCHNALATSSHRMATLRVISDSMTTNAQMAAIAALPALRFSELAALEVALNASIPGATPVPTAGAMLYASKCAGCHGDIPNHQHRGATAEQTARGISGRAEMRTPSLMALTPAELDSIAAAMR